MTLWAHLATEIWPCGPSQLQKCDLVGTISHRSITFRARSVTEMWPSGPIPLQKYDLHYDLQGPISLICMTFRNQSAACVWPSGPSQLYMYDLQDPVSCRGIATTSWLPWFCLLNHVTFGFTLKRKYKKEKETKENLGLKFMAETRKASCVCISLHCLFLLSAYIVCFLYRPLFSVCCERAVGMFIDIVNTTSAKCQREGILFHQHWCQACEFLPLCITYF